MKPDSQMVSHSLSQERARAGNLRPSENQATDGVAVGTIYKYITCTRNATLQLFRFTLQVSMGLIM